MTAETEKRRGTLTGVGVGPGDPELMTLKAVRIIRESDVIAVPGKTAEDSFAYRIAVQAVPELREKKVWAFDWPMTRDREILKSVYRNAADCLEKELDEGKNAAFLVIGDVSIYATFQYVEKLIKKDGYATAMVSGIPSFVAAAAALDIPLAEREEQIHVIPGTSGLEETLQESGTKVLMKAGKKLPEVIAAARSAGSFAAMAERCGLPGEKLYYSAEELPEEADYLSVMIVKS